MSRPRSRVRILLEYGLARAGLWFVGILPERPAYAVVGGIGRLFFRLSKRRQEYALRFLRAAYPEGKSDAELLALARVATGNIFKVSLDMVRSTKLIRQGKMRERVDIAEFRHAIERGPVLIVAAHLGSWEVGAMTVGLHTGEAHAIAREFKNPLLQRFLLDSRRAAGLHVHPKRGGIRPLTRALEAGGKCMTVVDQHQRLRGVQVPFFGRTASTERSAAKLALRLGCPVIVASCVRVGPGFEFAMTASEPLPIRATGDRDADVAAAAAVVNRGLEEHILRHPDQYLWIHNRYRDAEQSA